MTRSADCAPRNTPLTLTARILSSVDSSTSSTGVGNCGTPAFAKNTSSRPQRSAVWSTADLLSAAFDTSARMATAGAPVFSICSAAARAAPMSTSTTAARAAARGREPGAPAPAVRPCRPRSRAPLGAQTTRGALLLLFNSNALTRRALHELAGGERKDAVRQPGRGVDQLVLQEIAIDVD